VRFGLEGKRGLVRRLELELPLGMLDAEVEIAPEEKENGSFDAGFEKLDEIWCSDDEAVDDESSGGSDEKGPAERAQLEWEPR
jgi:hypothetical protein